MKSFAQTANYVKAIDGTSRQLRAAIEQGAKIIISTIHKFSTDQMSVLKNEAQRRFAILIDEAHSSQSGKHADSMARVLADGGISDEDERDEVEQALLELQRLRGPQANLSYLAFTATPRNVTMERFGISGPGGLPALLFASHSACGFPRLPGLPAVRRACRVLLPAGYSVQHAPRSAVRG